MKKYQFSENLRIMQEKGLQFAYEQSLQEDFAENPAYKDNFVDENKMIKTKMHTDEKTIS